MCQDGDKFSRSLCSISIVCFHLVSNFAQCLYDFFCKRTSTEPQKLFVYVSKPHINFIKFAGNFLKEFFDSRGFHAILSSCRGKLFFSYCDASII